MIRINLLPYRAAQIKENVRNQIIIFLFIIAAFTCVLGYFHFWFSGKIDALKTEKEKTQKEIVRYNKEVEKVEKIKQKMAVLKEKLKVIKKLDTDRYAAFRLLDSLTKTAVENRMWLTKFEAIDQIPKKTKKKKKKKEGEKEQKEKIIVNIKIEGIALDNKTVADFMLRLENAKQDGANLFTNIKLALLMQMNIKSGKNKPDISLKKFQIECQKADVEQSEKSKQKNAPKN
ncbi:PilN domain-containing protein [Desulfonema magnum]|uniref:Fimbrial assembly protein PilN domain-containing protein n=1 Tax=Desulfonema magnum TaxID=45655 RepID=A0A975BN46_9BACT|nr:PilN domain-containing protein [Desulfonema magnum]QTA88597.1 Fimbrial assembly protein PilN domain-containing protein [Desulfonema magnum]